MNPGNGPQAYQGVVLSVFFGGYATTQILGGKLADRYGGKMVLAVGVAGTWIVFGTSWSGPGVLEQRLPYFDFA